MVKKLTLNEQLIRTLALLH